LIVTWLCWDALLNRLNQKNEELKYVNKQRNI